MRSQYRKQRLSPSQVLIALKVLSSRDLTSARHHQKQTNVEMNIQRDDLIIARRGASIDLFSEGDTALSSSQWRTLAERHGHGWVFTGDTPCSDKPLGFRNLDTPTISHVDSWTDGVSRNSTIDDIINFRLPCRTEPRMKSNPRNLLTHQSNWASMPLSPDASKTKRRMLSPESSPVPGRKRCKKHAPCLFV